MVEDEDMARIGDGVEGDIATMLSGLDGGISSAPDGGREREGVLADGGGDEEIGRTEATRRGRRGGKPGWTIGEGGCEPAEPFEGGSNGTARLSLWPLRGLEKKCPACLVRDLFL
jgi:hypothetical protein